MSMDSWFPNPHDKDIAQLEEGLAYRAIKSGNNWILPSGKNAANGDPVVLDGVFGYATAAIVGGTDAIVEDTNWKPYGDGGALSALNSNMPPYLNNGVVYYRKHGNIVEIKIDDNTSRTINLYYSTTLGTLPEEYRPSAKLIFPCGVRVSWGFLIRIETNGEVQITNESDGQKTITRIWCHQTFCV